MLYETSIQCARPRFRVPKLVAGILAASLPCFLLSCSWTADHFGPPTYSYDPHGTPYPKYACILGWVHPMICQIEYYKNGDCHHYRAVVLNLNEDGSLSDVVKAVPEWAYGKESLPSSTIEQKQRVREKWPENTIIELVFPYVGNPPLNTPPTYNGSLGTEGFLVTIKNAPPNVSWPP